MYYKIYSITFFILLCLSSAMGQDIHFSRFYDAPAWLNPARTGDFLGTFRVGGIFRAQNHQLSNVYTTPNIYLDAPAFRGISKSHWVGIGLDAGLDNTGPGNLRTTGLTASLAYHIGFDATMHSSIAIGVSYGLRSRQVSNKEAYIFEQFLRTGSTTDQDNISDQPTNYGDISIGTQLNLNVRDRGNIKGGLSLQHINKPSYGVLKQTAEKLPLRINAYSYADLSINDAVDILPAVYASFIAGQRDIAVQLAGGLKINPESKTRIIAGAGYRLGDAIQFLVGMDIKNTHIGLSYDLAQNPIKPAGGYEISVSHYVNILKKPKDNPIILCPDL